MSATEQVAIVAVCDRIGCMRRRNFIGSDLRDARMKAAESGWYFGPRKRGSDAKWARCPQCEAASGEAHA